MISHTANLKINLECEKSKILPTCFCAFLKNKIWVIHMLIPVVDHQVAQQSISFWFVLHRNLILSVGLI